MEITEGEVEDETRNKAKAEAENELKDEAETEIEIGSHISISSGLYESIVNYYCDPSKYSIPIQIFVGNPQRFSRKKYTKEYLQCINAFITTNNLKVFIHGPYILNIARPKEEIMPALNCILAELDIAANMNSKGVVIHVGKYLKLSIEDATKNSMDNILFLLKNKKKNAKLLFETPAGQGTEMFTKIEEFISFVKDVYQIDIERVREHFGIVVDTCHVFASGYSPVDYIKEILSNDLKIDLIHLNDSMEEKGSKKDRHAYIGSGKIGIDTLSQCIEICKKENTPYLTE